MRCTHTTRLPAIVAQLASFNLRPPTVGDLLLTCCLLGCAEALVNSAAKCAAQGFAGALLYYGIQYESKGRDMYSP